MKYSSKITDLCNQYRLTPKDIAFALLVAGGCKRYEAFAFAFNCLNLQESTLTNKARELIKSKPALSRLLADLEFEKVNPPATVPSWSEYNELKAASATTANNPKEASRKGGGSKPGEELLSLEGWNDEESAAENLKRIYREELPGLQGREKIDMALKYAKLVGIDPETENSTHYYLPLSCLNCTLYIKHQEQNG